MESSVYVRKSYWGCDLSLRLRDNKHFEKTASTDWGCENIF